MLAEPAELLAAWEAGSRVSPVAQGAVLVERARLAGDRVAVLDLPIGTVAALAARLHAEAFGPTVEVLMRCEACGEDLDVEVPLDEFRSDAGAASATAAGMLVRSPTTRDLIAAGAAPDPARAVIERCVRHPDGSAADLDALDPGQLEQIDSAAEELAGAARVVLRGSCPACGADATAPLDVGEPLEQVARATRALLAEVAELGAAFGWSEAEVLRLTPLRRRAYLQLVRSDE